MGVLMGGETIPAPIPVVTLTGNGKGYATLTKDGDPGVPLSNWTMTAHKRIVNTDLNGKVTSKGLERCGTAAKQCSTSSSSTTGDGPGQDLSTLKASSHRCSQRHPFWEQKGA